MSRTSTMRIIITARRKSMWQFFRLPASSNNSFLFGAILLINGVIAVQSSQNVTAKSPSTSASSSNLCGLYLAPSSIPGAGLGMYNGYKPRSLWEPIGPADLVIPVTDYSEHNLHSQQQRHIMSFYGWNIPSFAHLDHDANADDTVAFCPGPGAALNCLMGLVNTVAQDEEVEYNTFTQPTGDRPPHAGSFTPFSNRQLIAKIPHIEPGAELFDDYGEAYFRVRPIYKTIPVGADYQEADELLEDYSRLREQVCGKDLCHASVNPAITTASSTPSSLHNSLYEMIHSLKSVWASPVLNALPNTPDTVDELTEHGTAMRDYNRSLKTIDWLETHGDCMDQIQIRPSLIPNAGNGAFASAFIPKGHVVGPAPALHIPREFMNMYPLYFDEEEQEFNVNATAAPVHQQLLVNYCLGHNQSTVLLCPYGAATLAINHNAQSPNTKIEWNFKLMQHPEWLDMPISEWIDELSAGLVLNYVALRDIQVGEEITMDYGSDWQQAWEQHVRNFQPPKDRANYEDALTLNEREQELRLPPFRYDDTFVQLKCRGMYLRWLGTNNEEIGYSFETDKEKYLCRPLFRSTDALGESMYVVQVYEIIGNKKQCMEEEWEIVFGMPRDALVFEDRLYSRDHAQPWSFRHPSGLPDEIFPDAWRDLIDADRNGS